MSTNKKRDIPLIFGMLTTLIVVWIYILNLIVGLGTLDPIHILLIPLSVLHYAIFILVLNSILLLYIYGVEEVAKEFQNVKIIRYRTGAERLLYTLWAPILIWTSFGIIIALASDPDTNEGVQIYVPLIIGLVLVALISFILFGKAILIFLKGITWRLFLNLFGYFPFLIILAFATADIGVVTDKTLYLKSDTALVALETKGYIFLPSIKSTTFNIDTLTKDNSIRTFRLGLNRPNSSYNFFNPYIEVSFEDQILGIKRKSYHYVKVADAAY